MIIDNRIENLRETHIKLLEKCQEEGNNEETLQEIKTFLTKMHGEGSNVFNPQERDLLRSFILYWGNFIYDRTKSYPDMTLAPFSGAIPRKKLLSGWRIWIVIVIGVLVLFAFIGPLQFIRSYLPVRPQHTVRILQPYNGDSVPYEIQIRGDYRGNVRGWSLWVIVYPHNSQRYYPQRPVEIRSDNSWRVVARFGQDSLEANGKIFDVSIYLASSQTDRELREYIKEADRTGYWSGMPSVPNGLTLLDRVTVIRR